MLRASTKFFLSTEVSAAPGGDVKERHGLKQRPAVCKAGPVMVTITDHTEVREQWSRKQIAQTGSLGGGRKAGGCMGKAGPWACQNYAQDVVRE